MFSIQPEQISKYIVETLNEGVWIINGEMQTQFVNRQMAEMLGCLPAEMEGANLLDFVFEDDKEEIFRKIERLKQGIREEFEFRCRRKDDSPLWAHVLTSPLYDETGKFIAALGMFTDITERKQAEETLKEQENQLRLINDNLPALVSYVDDEHRYQFVNKTYLDWFGLKAEEVVGRHISEIIGEEIYKTLLPEIERVLKGEKLTFERRLFYKEKGRRFVRISYIPDVDDEGNAQGYFALVIDITDEKQTEKELEKSDERYRAFVSRSSEAIWRVEMEESISIDLAPEEQIRQFYKYAYLAECNDAMAKMYGYERAEEIVGARLGDLLPQTDESNIEYLKAFIASGYRLENAESHEVDREGNPKFFLNNLVGFIEYGFMTRAWGTQRDITESKKAEQALRRSEERYRLVAETASDAIISIDEDSAILFTNAAAERIFGYKVEELIGQPLTKLMPENMRERHRAGICRYLQTGKRKIPWESIEVPALHADGHIFPLEISFGEYREDGKRFFIGIARDITERKKAEESRARLAAVVESSADAIYSYDLEGYIISWNISAEKLLRYTEAEIVGQKVHKIIPPDRAGEPEMIIASIKKGQSVVSFETLRMRKGEEIFDAFMTASPIKDASGNPVAVSIILRDITERKEAENRLRKSEELYRTLFDLVPVAVYTCDEKGGIQEFNKRAVELWGREPKKNNPAEKFCGSFKILYPDGRVMPHEKCPMARILRGEIVKASDAEILIEKPDGARRSVIALPRTLKDERGKIIGAINCLYDITERKQIEEQLKYQLDLTETITENTQSCLLMMDARGRGTFANYATERVTGFKPDELIGEILHYKIHHTHPDGKPFPIEECPLDNALPLQEAVIGYEDVFIHKDGHFYPVRCAGRPIFKDGKAVGTVIEVQDITEEKHAQEALIKAERRAAEEYHDLLQRIVPLGQTLGTSRDLISIYRALLDFVQNSMPCSAFFVSFYESESSLRTAAYAWGEQGEVDISDLPPMLLTEDGGPNSQAVFQKKSVVVNRFMDFMEKRPHIIIQENGIDPQTSLVVPMVVMNRVVGTLEAQAYESNAFNSEHIVALEMVANLAAVAIENVRLLQVEAKARETAEAANRAKDEFLSVLSHELRTPLNSMLGWLSMLRRGILDEERAAQAIEVIERNTRLQNNLIEDLLDVSRIISGKMRIEKEEIDLVAVAGNTFETLRPSAESKNILFEFSSEVETLPLEGDAARIHQIISNLIQNAIKFTAGEGKITVCLEKNHDSARLIVKDTGIGIEKGVLPHIFERFRQADASTRRAYSGLGLGLTIVNNLVELHGGKVYAESAGKGEGATFTVELPISKGCLLKENNDGENFSEKNNFGLSGARILLVDDDADSILPLQMLLEKEKAEVEIVLSAEEALKKLTEQNYHILISDIGMPSTDGYDLIAKIRQLSTEQNAFLPAIALTAYASSEDRRRALSAGFQMHFSKPFDFEELLAAIVEIYKNSK